MALGFLSCEMTKKYSNINWRDDNLHSCELFFDAIHVESFSKSSPERSKFKAFLKVSTD